jgi:hypothetical protein
VILKSLRESDGLKMGVECRVRQFKDATVRGASGEGLLSVKAALPALEGSYQLLHPNSAI